MRVNQLVNLQLLYASQGNQRLIKINFITSLLIVFPSNSPC